MQVETSLSSPSLCKVSPWQISSLKSCCPRPLSLHLLLHRPPRVVIVEDQQESHYACSICLNAREQKRISGEGGELQAFATLRSKVLDSLPPKPHPRLLRAASAATHSSHVWQHLLGDRVQQHRGAWTEGDGAKKGAFSTKGRCAQRQRRVWRCVQHLRMVCSGLKKDVFSTKERCAQHQRGAQSGGVGANTRCWSHA